MHTYYFISHPNVVINASLPVTHWPLSSEGIARMKVLLNKPWIKQISGIYCSSEQKAIDGACILQDYLNVPYKTVSELGENDRSSTGFLEPAEFEITANAFFANPDKSIRGWETATHAKNRITAALYKIDSEAFTPSTIAIISHGAVGTLLYCQLTGNAIDRKWDQPGTGGGNFMKFTLGSKPTCTWWQPID